MNMKGNFTLYIVRHDNMQQARSVKYFNLPNTTELSKEKSWKKA